MISGDDVCCSVVFGTLFGVFSVMLSRVVDDICYLLSSVYECYKVECAFASPVSSECGMLLCAVCSVVCLCQLFCSA